jgi:hypothetical protein
MDTAIGNPQVTEADIGWLAGIIDGEGHLGISTQNQKRGDSVKFDLQITNTDNALIGKLVRILRKLGVNPHLRERTHDKATWATNCIVTVAKLAHIRIVLNAALPHLTGWKYRRAAIMLTLIESRMTKNRQPYDEIERALVEQFRAVRVEQGTSSTTRVAVTY